MNSDELRMEIRRVIGVSTRADIPTDPKSGTRRFVDSINRLDDDQLALLLNIARTTVTIDRSSGDERREGWGPFAGEDSVHLVHLINKSDLDEALILGQNGVELPDGMRVKDALWTVRDLKRGSFATAPILVNAHLYVAHSLRQKHSRGYTLAQMFITQNHPDKAGTVVALASKNSYITETEVVMHHGVEPVLFDGVL
jgi:hypothetical protein